MKILPVLDLLHGEVVRGQGGQRANYRPIQSKITVSTKPVAVAEAFRQTFGFSELYLADLDAILGSAPAFPIYTELRLRGFNLWLDAGVRCAEDAIRLADAGIETIVLGLETLKHPWEFCRTLHSLDEQRIVFSLDMKQGKPLANSSDWQAGDALELAQWIIRSGGRRLLLLDLAHVGGYAGTGTESLSRELAAQFPNAEISVGGGIRSIGEVRTLASLGVANVLIASALHDGLIGPNDPKFI
jgi:phosphoribosylformimino-5-aminoimidazole carboxamide ribotide isomerase